MITFTSLKSNSIPIIKVIFFQYKFQIHIPHFSYTKVTRIIRFRPLSRLISLSMCIDYSIPNTYLISICFFPRLRIDCWMELMYLLGKNLTHHTNDVVKVKTEVLFLKKDFNSLLLAKNTS